MYRLKPPKTSLIAPLPFSVPEKRLLRNGVPYYIIHGGTEEIVRIELLFLAGSFFQHKPLVTYSALNLLKAGTARKTSAEISEIIDFYGAYLQIDTQKDIVSVSIFVLNKYLEPLLALLSEMVQKPSFPQSELDILMRNQKHQHIVNSRKVAYIARLHFAERIYGSAHPYGYRLRKNDFDNVERNDLVLFHKQWIHPANLNIIVSGKVPSNAEKLLDAFFGNAEWESPRQNPPEPVYPINANGDRKLLIFKQEALQSAIRIGKRTINRNHYDYHRLVIANALLGGYFGSRLMKNIRQEKGFTYGINSALVSLLRDGYFFIGTQVGTDACQEAVDQIFEEISNLQTKPATASELQSLKNYMSGNFLRSFDGPFALAERFKELLVFGLDKTHFDLFINELKQTTPETIMQTAAQYLCPESMFEVVSGKL